MPHPHRRTWTLGTLDREIVWRLWFDPVAFRWEVAAEGRGHTADSAGGETTGQRPEDPAGGGGGGSRTGARSPRWRWARPA